MIRLHNHQAVLRIAKNSMNAYKKRNILIISAIILTTLLITAVFTTGFSINQTIERTYMKTVGSDFHGSFKYLTPQEAEQLTKHPAIREYGQSVSVGEIVDEQLKGYSVELKQINQQIVNHGFIKFQAGGLPKTEQDIVLNTWTLDLLNIPHKLGEKVRLPVNINGQIVTKDFLVAGFYEANQYIAMAGLGYVSEAFVESNLSHIDPVETRKTGTYTNTVNLDVMLNNSWNIEEKLQKVMDETDVKTSYGVNWAYTTVSLSENMTSIIPFLVLIIITMLSGYLLIYNIFYISVIRDIRFYGLLKTIGTTPKQLKKLITLQANRLYVIALPIGLALGYGVGMWLSPMMMSISDIKEGIVYSVNPMIFLGAALFSYLTVRIAASKPGRLASKISPIEAVKYSGMTMAGKKKVKTSTQGARLPKMALRNLFRQKKKLVLMLSSLSLSILLFSIIYIVISSINVNTYVNSFIAGDFVITESTSSSAEMTTTENDHGLTEEIGQALESIEGVQRADRVYLQENLIAIDDSIQAVLQPIAEQENAKEPIYREILNQGKVWRDLYGISEGWFNLISKQDIVAGTLDREKFASGKYIIVTEGYLGNQHQSYYQPGDIVTLTEQGESYEVLAVISLDAIYAAGNKKYTPAGFKIFMLTEKMKQLAKDAKLLSITLQVDEHMKDQVELALQSITKASSDLVVKSRDDYKAELNGFIRVFETIGYSLSFIIAFIGVLNYVNTMLTSVLTRRNEFAVMESVGMTKKQVKKLLLFEGIISILLTGGLMCTLGMLVIYLVAKGLTDQIEFTEFEMTIWPTSIALIILLFLSILVTLIAYRSLSKKTVVERLREVE